VLCGFDLLGYLSLAERFQSFVSHRWSVFSMLKPDVFGFADLGSLTHP